MKKKEVEKNGKRNQKSSPVDYAKGTTKHKRNYNNYYEEKRINKKYMFCIFTKCTLLL